MNGVDPIKILDSGLHSMDSTSLEFLSHASTSY